MLLGYIGMKVPLISVCLLVVGKMLICVIEVWHLTMLSRNDYIKIEDSYVEARMGSATMLTLVKQTPSPCVRDT